MKKPLSESAALVEEIVHQQMVSFMLRAIEIAQTRNPTSTHLSLDVDDCLFLLRKDRVKLKRLYKFVMVRDLKEKANSAALDSLDDEPKEGESKKLKTSIKNFVRSIDDPAHSLASYLDRDFEDAFGTEDNDDDDYVDAVKMERLKRAELQSRRMSVQQYLEFAGARGVSFGRGKAKNKLKDWLFLGSRHLEHLDVKVSSHALDVVCYLAKETVAEIVDSAILVQQEAMVRIEDPTTHVRDRPACVKRENSASSVVTSRDKVNIPGLGGHEETPLTESRGPLQPWHIREAVARHFQNGFSPFSLKRKRVDHSRLAAVLLCS